MGVLRNVAWRQYAQPLKVPQGGQPKPVQNPKADAGSPVAAHDSTSAPALRLMTKVLTSILNLTLTT